MRKYIAYTAALCIISIASAYAQQSGNYHSEYVSAKVWSRNKEGKVIIADWKPFETRLIGNFTDFSPAEPVILSKYGGDQSVKVTSTGFFRAQKIEDRWWLIDPLGHPAMHIAVNSVVTGPSKRNKEAFKRQFADKAGWIVKSAGMIHSFGFNGTGSWSDTETIIAANKTLKAPIVYTINLSFMSSYGDHRGGTYQAPGHKAYPNNVIFVFDPGFEKFCNERAKQLAQYKDDPNLLGYFSDNEMPFSLKCLEGYLALSNHTDPGYIAAKKWMDERNLTLDGLTDRHREEFLSYVAEKYFSVVSAVIKKYDLNHLYLGCRFYSGEKNVPAFMKTAGKYLDVVSINYYGAWTPSKESMANWANWAGKPFIITEFYTKGEDSGLANTSGAGWIVKTQADRGKAYQNFCLALLESKNCVGWHWFKYQDNDPSTENAEPSNIDGNKGLVDNLYQVYMPLAEKMKELNFNRYDLIRYFDRINK